MKFKLSKLGPLSLFIIFIHLVFSQSVWAGRVEDRMARIEATTAQRFENHNILFKLIESRASVLYLTDILPEKANPYYHMAQFGVVATLEPFKAARKNTLEMNVKGVWLPKNNGKDLTATDLSDAGVNALVDYFALYVAIAETFENVVYPVLAQSPLIDSQESSVGKDKAEKFFKVFGNPKTGNKGHIQFIKEKYSQLLGDNPLLAEKLKLAQRKVLILIMSALAEQMEAHLSYVDSSVSQSDLQKFINEVKSLNSLSVLDSGLKTTRKNVMSAFRSNKNSAKAAQAAFSSVDLPESGSIDGAEDSFETVMRLEVGYEVLLKMKEEVSKW